MNLKAVLMLCLILFAFASTIATLTISVGTGIPKVFGTATAITQNVESGRVQPMGDPVDNPLPGSN